MWPPTNLWDDPQALVSYYQIYAIPLRPQAGILVLSIIVSILGSYATLLCLGRRSGAGGWRNYALLFASALCFAAVAVWGMHFVSMISVRLRPTPDITWSLRFAAGFTTISLFVPLVAVTFAFWFLGDEAEFSWWRIPFAGVFVGLTIGLMHYSASFKLPLLEVSYSAVTVVFALILACVAATAALYTFFRFRAQWVDSWWRRGLCAIFLATAVCGMHYLGLGGTSYRVKSGVEFAQLGASGGQATRLTIVISVMCGVIILLAIALIAYDQLSRTHVKRAARHIVIASAAFDDYGRLLVKPDGTLPMQVIETDAEIERVLSQCDPRNPTFQWLYLLSFNWGLLRPFVKRMYRRMKVRGEDPTYSDPLNFDLNLDQSWDNLMFRTRFLEAAVCLAQNLDIGVENLGILFDRILSTGTKGKQDIETKEQYEKKIDEWTSDYGGSVHGITLKLQASEGVMLFLVRKIENVKPFYHLLPEQSRELAPSTDNIDNYQARGYRMAEPRFFARAFADRVGVNKAEMEVFLSACKTFAKRGHKYSALKGGIYVSIFGIRPCGRGSENDLEVLVYNFAHHQIPAFRLPEIKTLMSPDMAAWIRSQTGNSLGNVLKEVNNWIHLADEEETDEQQRDPHFIDFMAALSVSLEGLINTLRVWPNLAQEAKLSADVVHLPGATDSDLPCQMILFELVLPAPIQRLTPVNTRTGVAMPPLDVLERARNDRPPQPFIYTPFSLFCRTQSQIHKGPRYKAHARVTTAELNRLYPPFAEDTAAVAHAEDRMASHVQGQGQISDSIARIHQLWNRNRHPDYGIDATASYSVSLSGHDRDAEKVTSPNPSNSSADLEKGLVGQMPSNFSKRGMSQSRSRPGTAGEAIKGAIGTLMGRPRDKEPPMPNKFDMAEMPVPRRSTVAGEGNAYAWVRDTHDAWCIRHVEWLEEHDKSGMMEGNAWRIQAIGPGGGAV